MNIQNSYFMEKQQKIKHKRSATFKQWKIEDFSWRLNFKFKFLFLVGLEFFVFR